MLLSLLLWACDSDVSIIKRIEEEETGQVIESRTGSRGPFK